VRRIDYLEPLFTDGSVPGALLLFYATCVSALCSAKARRAPFNLSGIERSPLSTYLVLLSIPGSIWILVYLLGHLGILVGVISYIVVGVLTVIIIQMLAFNTATGIHLILALVGITLGFILTIKTHPF
jgi:hypothetical protein